MYLTTKTGLLHCLDLGTGEERYAERLSGPCWATPVAACDRLYCFGRDGTTTVVKIGPSFEVLATNYLWDKSGLAARRAAAWERPEDQFPPLPPKGREAMEGMLAEAVGDVVYGIAAADSAFFVRTGTELICVRRTK